VTSEVAAPLDITYAPRKRHSCEAPMIFFFLLFLLIAFATFVFFALLC